MSVGHDFSLDRDVPRVIADEDDRPYIDALASNPAWQAFAEEITQRASEMIQQLLSMKQQRDQTREQFCADRDALIGKITGLLTYIEEPVVIRRAIDARRDR